MDAEALMSAILVALGLVLVLVPFKRNGIIGFRAKAAYTSEGAWRRTNRYFGSYLLLIGVLTLFFSHFQHRHLYLLSLLFIASIATYFKAKSNLVTSASLFAVFALTCTFAYPSLPQELGVHFSGLSIDGWESKSSYMYHMAALFSLITLISFYAARFRAGVLPVIHVCLVFLIFINAIVISIPFFGEGLIALIYPMLAAFLAFLVVFYKRLDLRAVRA